MTSLPKNIEKLAANLLRQKLQIDVALYSFTAINGGCINNGGRLRTSAGDFFIKWNNSAKFPRMFEAEAKGLNLLASCNSIYIPEVIGYFEDNIDQLIILEFIESSNAKTKNYWPQLAQALAAVHNNTHNNFGLDHENYIGSLKQVNSYTNSWTDFFIESRLRPQIKLAVDNGMGDRSLTKKFELLFALLPDMLPQEKPSLLHGDLWSGNVLLTSDGSPCLIDPAVYYGNREGELAFTKLFGGFTQEFYAVYHESFPLLPNHHERENIYNLYPLLVHANLFGQSYLLRVNSILNSIL